MHEIRLCCPWKKNSLVSYSLIFRFHPLMIWWLSVVTSHFHKVLLLLLVVVGSRGSWGLKVTQEISSPTSCSELGQLWNQTMFPASDTAVSWKPPKMETAQCFWAACSNGWLSSWGKYLSFYPVRYSPFNLYMLLLVFLLYHASDLVLFSLERRRLQRNLHVLTGGYGEDRDKILNW